MELKSSSSSSTPYLQPSVTLPSTRRNSFQGVGSGAAAGGRGGGNPYGSTLGDPLCSLNLKETSEFVRSSFPMATMARSNSSNGTGAGHGYHHETSTTSSSSSSTASAHRRRVEQQQVPGTPGRPLLFLAASSSSPAHHQLVSARRSVPSKWEDAEKWLRQSADHRGHHHGKTPNLHNGGLVRRATGEEKTAQARRSSLDSVDASALALYTSPAEVLLKDRFTDNVEPSKESFVFRSSYCEPAKDTAVAADDLCRRDIGTEMTPLGSSRTSRCHTPIKSTSPARHNTPTGRSGPLVPYNNGNGMDISELTDCHFAKLELGTQFDAMLVNWSSKEEEEEEVSKSLRHFEASIGSGVGTCDKRAGTAECRWEDDEKTKSCIRYQREEAKIHAWINLESAKAEAQSRKLEVKIQKMRSNLEEKLMKRMTTVHRRGEEWRAAAQAQHLQQLKRANTDHARRVRTISHHLSGSNASCGCFPYNNNIISGNLLKYTN